MLFYVFRSFDESYSTHDVIAIFDAEDFSDFFRDSDSSARYYFGEERNVFFIDLYGQLFASRANG